MTEVFTDFGENGVSAETVAKGTVDRARTMRMGVRDVPEVVTSSIVPSSTPVLA